MKSMLQRLWADDRGAVISVEWIMFTVFFIVGLLPAMVMLRQAIFTALANAANYIIAVSASGSVTDNGTVFNPGPGAGTIPNAAVNGFQVNGAAWTPANFIPNGLIQQQDLTFQGTLAFQSNTTNVAGNAANVIDPSP